MMNLPILDVPESFTPEGMNPYGMVQLTMVDQLLLYWVSESDDFDSSECSGESVSHVTLFAADVLALSLAFAADQSVSFEHGSYPHSPTYCYAEWCGVPADFDYRERETIPVFVSDRGWPDIPSESYPADSEALEGIREYYRTLFYGPECEGCGMRETDCECSEEEAETESAPDSFASELRACEEFYSDPELFGNDGTIPTDTEGGNDR